MQQIIQIFGANVLGAMICILWCAAFTFPYLVLIKRCLLRVNKVAELLGLDATQRLLGRKELKSFVQFVITEYYPENAGEYLIKKKRLLEAAKKGNKKARALVTKEELTKIKEVLDNEIKEVFGADAELVLTDRHSKSPGGMTFQERLSQPLEAGGKKSQKRNPNVETEELDALVDNQHMETSRAGGFSKRVFDHDDEDEVNFSFDKRDGSIGHSKTKSKQQFEKLPQRSTLSRKDQFKKPSGIAIDMSHEEDSQTHEGEISNNSSQADNEAVSQSVLKQNVVESAANVKASHAMRSGNSSRVGFINNLAFGSGFAGVGDQSKGQISEISSVVGDASSSAQSRQDPFARGFPAKKTTEDGRGRNGSNSKFNRR